MSGSGRWRRSGRDWRYGDTQYILREIGDRKTPGAGLVPGWWVMREAKDGFVHPITPIYQLNFERAEQVITDRRSRNIDR